MSLILMRFRGRLVSLLLNSILKSLRIKNNVNANSDLLNFSRKLEKELGGVREKIYAKQENMILFSVNFDGALDASNIFFKRLEKNVRKRLHSTGVDEYLMVDFEEGDENNKSP